MLHNVMFFIRAVVSTRALQRKAWPSVETRLIGTVDLQTARRVIALFLLLELFQYEIHNKSVILSTIQNTGSQLIAQDVGGGISLWQPFCVTSGRRAFEQTELDYPISGTDHN